MISQFAPTDIGPPHYWDKMPEMSKKNYGQWQYHEYLKPGVMKGSCTVAVHPTLGMQHVFQGFTGTTYWPTSSFYFFN